MQIMRVVLGESCTRFQAGHDGGRDGWFQGTASARWASEGKSGRFLIQCKHSSSPSNSLVPSDLAKEIEKIERYTKNERAHYILMTNRRCSAPNEKLIREAFERITGVASFTLLQESWIEATADREPRLLRLIPRLYGIGDLTQILSSGLQQQTVALLEDLANSLRTFVPTDSYRRAERALHEHGFVVLVGSPAAGKSAIAANLCMVSSAQNANVRVIRVESAEQFKNSWSPGDKDTIYWVDDVFGETTLDGDRLREWSAALEKVEAARKRGARILFCTRDYILAAAEQQIKQAKAAIINDARVRVDVTSIAKSERELILYNHIKYGDLSKDQKTALKPFLPAVAGYASFTPELARRLGTRRFNSSSRFTERYLQDVFSKPVAHLREVIHGLSNAESAALALCLLGNNSVPDPLNAEAVPATLLETYGVTRHEIHEALEFLEGSLVKRVRTATEQHWQLHHPSMIDALQEELAERSSQLELYIRAAKLSTLLLHVTTTGSASRLVFVPQSLYPSLVDRMCAVEPGELDTLGRFLTSRASDELLVTLNTACPEVLDRVLGVETWPFGEETAAHLAMRLSDVSDLLLPRRRELLASTLEEGIGTWGWMGFLGVADFESVMPDFVRSALERAVTGRFRELEVLSDCLDQNLDSDQELSSAIEVLNSQAKLLAIACNQHGLLDKGARRSLEHSRSSVEEHLADTRSSVAERQEEARERYADDWADRWRDERDEGEEQECGLFADVDE